MINSEKMPMILEMCIICTNICIERVAVCKRGSGLDSSRVRRLAPEEPITGAAYGMFSVLLLAPLLAVGRIWGVKGSAWGEHGEPFVCFQLE